MADYIHSAYERLGGWRPEMNFDRAILVGRFLFQLIAELCCHSDGRRILRCDHAKAGRTRSGLVEPLERGPHRFNLISEEDVIIQNRNLASA